MYFLSKLTYFQLKYQNWVNFIQKFVHLIGNRKYKIEKSIKSTSFLQIWIEIELFSIFLGRFQIQSIALLLF